MSGSQADSELGQRWLAALRSGECKWGKRTMRCEDRYCALGVLCDLIDPAGWRSLDSEDRLHEWATGGAAYPPVWVLSLVGLTRSQASQVAAASDSDGLSAAADVAERLMSGAAA